jgi:hypothetical protein
MAMAMIRGIQGILGTLGVPLGLLVGHHLLILGADSSEHAGSIRMGYVVEMCWSAKAS